MSPNAPNNTEGSSLDRLIETSRNEFFAISAVLHLILKIEMKRFAVLTFDQIISKGHAPMVAYIGEFIKIMNSASATSFIVDHTNRQTATAQMRFKTKRLQEKFGQDMENYGPDHWLLEIQECTHVFLRLLRLKLEEIVPGEIQENIDDLLNELGIAYKGSDVVLEKEEDEELEELEESRIEEIEKCAEALDKILLLRNLKYYQTKFPVKL